MVCGCSETGIRNFGWKCRQPQAGAGINAKTSQANATLLPVPGGDIRT